MSFDDHKNFPYSTVATAPSPAFAPLEDDISTVKHEDILTIVRTVDINLNIVD